MLELSPQGVVPNNSGVLSYDAVSSGKRSLTFRRKVGNDPPNERRSYARLLEFTYRILIPFNAT